MSRYERSFDTDWESLTVDQAVQRAYALGVAASLGEYHPDELEAVREEMGSAYERSVVDLAFEEGENEARKEELGEAAGDQEVWESLVDDEPADAAPDDVPIDDRDGLPEAVNRVDVLDRPTPSENEAVELPSFLERD